MTGTVTDPANAVVPGAKVTVTNKATATQLLETKTNETGAYTAPNLPAGVYRITVEASGFKTSVLDDVTLAVGENLRVDAVLQIGSEAESVQVTAEVPRIQSESSEVATQLSNKTLQDLPLSFVGGRHAENFAFSIAPGVMGTSYNSHINGSTNYSKETLIEGATVTVLQAGDSSAGYVSMEALQEARVQVSGLSAEYGRTQGGVVNMTMKSGANQIHGSAFGALRNEALDANTLSNNALGYKRGLDRKDNYAFSFGGPVYIPKVYNGHNKTFFYGAYERYHESAFTLSSPSRTEPIADFYNGNFSRLLGSQIGTDSAGNGILKGAIYDPNTFRQLSDGSWTGSMFPGNIIPVSRFSRVSSNLNAIAQKYYLPTVKDANGVTPLTNNEPFPSSTQPIWDHYVWSIKIDHNINDRQRLSGSVVSDYEPRLILDSGGMWNNNAPNGGPLAKARQRDDTWEIARLADDWTLSPTLLNNVTLGWNRRGNPQTGTQAGIDGAKELGIANLTTPGYPNVNWGGGPSVSLENAGFIYNSFRADMSYALMDTLSYSHGKHFLKFGADLRDAIQNTESGNGTSFTFSARGTAIPNNAYAGSQIGYAFASYLLGIVDSASMTVPTSYGGRRHYYSLFVQDDYKVRRNLTLNLGLRWEFQPPVQEVANRYSSWSPNVIDPKSGLPGAYQFAGNCSECTGQSYFGHKDYKGFGPRLGFSWQPVDKWVVRGSYGILYEGDVFSGYNPTPLGTATSTAWAGSYLLSASSVNPWTGIFNWDNGFPTDRYAPATKNLSYGDTSRPGMIDPNYGSMGYIQQWNFGIQRELPKHVLLDITYLGNKGTGLKVGELEAINQLNPSVLAKYGTALGNTISSAADAAKYGISLPYPGFVGSLAAALRPYPQVNGTSTVQVYGAPLGFSVYHSLQVSVNHDFRNGISVLANYVWSKSLSNFDSSFIGDTGAPLDYYNLKIEKSLSSYDVPQAAKAYITYDLPVGKGKKWLTGAPRAVNAAIGGWQVAGILNYYSGTPITFSSSSPLSSWNGGTNRANVISDDAMLNPSFDSSLLQVTGTSGAPNTYLNKANFSQPAALTLGTGAKRYGNARAFPTRNEDVALVKNTRIAERFRFQIRGEALNVFNRHTWGGVSGSVNSATFGQVTSVSGNRQIQVSARLDF
ncbi:MAG: TonB-dependent receptor [Ignavibacteriota bacterium]